jgi:DNA primase
MKEKTSLIGTTPHWLGPGAVPACQVRSLVVEPVYGLARLDLSHPVFVVEGIVDYVTLWQRGYQAAATLGTSIKAQDTRELAQAARVVFVPDSDEAGEAAAARRREAVGHGHVLRLPEGVDDVNNLAQQPDGEAVAMILGSPSRTKM